MNILITWSELANSKNGWEGFMVRKDVGYEGKRSKNLLKIKKVLSMLSIK